MFKNSSFLIFISLLGMFACSSKTSKEKVAKLEIPTDSIKTLKGEVAFPDLFLARPGKLSIIGNNLLILDPYNGKFLTLVDLDKPKKTERLMHCGNGHNEMSFLVNMLFHEPKNAVSLYDIERKNIRMYKIENNLINLDSKSLLSSVRIKTPEFCRIVPLGDKYIAHDNFDGHQLSLFDKDGELIQTFGTYPGNKDGINKSNEFQNKTQGNLAVSPDQKHFVIAGLFHDQLTFYKVTDTIPEKIKEYFNPESRPNKSIPDNTAMYDTPVATNKNLYVLYWGVTMEEIKSKSHDGTCTVLVFDWDGNLTQTYKIPDFLDGIAVDENNNCLYGITQAENAEMQIMKYQL